VVESVAEARELLGSFAPDLVIADLHLPDGLGLDLAPASRSGAYPIIVMTSQGGESVAVEAMKAGALDYVVKGETAFEELPLLAARALAEWRARVARKRAELENAQRERELRDAQKMEALGRLAGNIAHDFNDALMGIIACADIALSRLPPATGGRRQVAELRESAMEAAGRARRLLAFSRGDAEVVSVDVDSAIRAMEGPLRSVLGADTTLEFALDAAGASAELGAGEVEQMVMSLAINSRDAMPTGGTVTISTTVVDSRSEPKGQPLPRREDVRITISDTGYGMDEATLARACEPFFTTKGAAGGTGLGLSSVYGFVTRSGGRLELESVLGKGTTVRAYLPRMSV
jgi:signal transduction histidine kinase